jgi:multiple sugar transport system substrate-binding protein
MNTISRRGFLATTAAATAMTAAGPRIAHAQDRADPASLLRGVGTTLEFRNWGAIGREVEGANRFLDANSDLSVNWVNVSFGSFRDAMATEFVGGSRLDATTIPESELAGWAEAGFIRPVDDLPGYEDLAADALGGAVTAGLGIDGRAYGIPYTSDPFGYVYNRRILNEAGFEAPPTTMDEVRTQMEAIKKAGLQEFPLHLSLKQEPGQMWSIWGFVFASGGRLFDDGAEPLFDGADDTLRNVLEWYVAAVNDWKIAGPDDFGKNWADGRNDMKQGLISAGCLADWALRFSNVDEDSSVKGEVFLALMPGLNGNDGASVGAFHQIGVTGSTTNVDPSWRFVHHLSGPEADGSYQTHRERSIGFGGRGAYKSVLAHPDYRAMVDRITNGDSAAHGEIAARVRQKDAVKQFWYPEWEAFWMQQVQDAVSRKVGVVDALKASADRARALARS